MEIYPTSEWELFIYKLKADKWCIGEPLRSLSMPVLTQRRLAEQAVTLEELSGIYDVSRERIRQIEVRAFEKLQTRMRELAEEKARQ